MSLAWRLLQEAIEDGRIVIDTTGAEKDVEHEIQTMFSKPSILKPINDVPEKVSTDANIFNNEKESANLNLDENPFPYNSVDDFDPEPDSTVYVSRTAPSHEERLQGYLDDAAQKTAAAKAYRKALLSGQTKNAIPVKKPKRQCHIYRDIVMQKLSRKFAIPKADFKELVDEVMEEEFPDYGIEDEALVALQRESEMMVTKMMCLVGHLANHADRETVRVKDFELLKLLFYKNKEGCYFDSGC